eukprot:m.356737 g.356737  ORF g.356737 m.356737 type:complete len:119 (+) comp17614_c0_seq1:140-496(+)
MVELPTKHRRSWVEALLSNVVGHGIFLGHRLQPTECSIDSAQLRFPVCQWRESTEIKGWLLHQLMCPVHQQPVRQHMTRKHSFMSRNAWCASNQYLVERECTAVHTSVQSVWIVLQSI